MRMCCDGTTPVGVGMDNSGTTKINHDICSDNNKKKKKKKEKKKKKKKKIFPAKFTSSSQNCLLFLLLPYPLCVATMMVCRIVL